jgi:hypothetical protein
VLEKELAVPAPVSAEVLVQAMVQVQAIVRIQAVMLALVYWLVE